MIHFSSYFLDGSLLLMRLVLFAVFFTSGWGHLASPEERARSIGMSKAFTIFLGLAELSGSLGIALGVLTHFAALGLVLIMLGAIQKKAFEWHIGFWGKGEGTNNGWHYDLMLIAMNLVIAATGGGRWVLFP
ncbi:MAG: DoxX family protein [Acidobacteria bacterium]|nr:DoxX family protein [Acidobacteriota bacterium]